MPTNQSSPWGGAKVRRCTISPTKVPLSQSQTGKSVKEPAQCEDGPLMVRGRPLSANHRTPWTLEAPPPSHNQPMRCQKVKGHTGASLGSVTNHISSISLSPASSEETEEEQTGVQGGGAMEEQEAGPDEGELSDEDESFPFKPVRSKRAGRLSPSSSEDASVTSSSSVDEDLMSVDDDAEERPALVPSLFPLTPPTLYFSNTSERVELLPAEQRRLLKWKLSSVTPNVVKHTITRSHFKITKKDSDWLGCWGHHMKSPAFKTLGEHQKLNHFPGTFQIGRKDRLWRNLSKMKSRFGKAEFSFFPQTFILPQDIKLLRKAWEGGASRQTWIIKPPASARGTGIQVIHKWSQMPRKRPLLVQKYLHKPFLIGGSKFDLRIYVYVTSYDPLTVYIYSDGLVRFASCKYSTSMKTLSNKFMHLTNYSVNKKNAEYQSNSDHTACQGHKWSLKALWQHLGSQGIDTSLIWEKIKDIVVKTIIASEPFVLSLMKTSVRSSYSCHELFGFDIMLDEKLKPWILEVNISPSLHSNSPLDHSIKGNLITDLLNLAGFRLPVSSCSSSSSSCRERSDPELSADEKVKRMFYVTQRSTDQDFQSSVLDVLTPGDVRVLVQSEDELSRRGRFQRVFPSPCSSPYLRLFQCPRYLNVLLNQWEQRHGADRSPGVSLLKTLCHKGVHMGTNEEAHMWSKSSYVSRVAVFGHSPESSGLGPAPSQEDDWLSSPSATPSPGAGACPSPGAGPCPSPGAGPCPSPGAGACPSPPPASDGADTKSRV